MYVSTTNAQVGIGTDTFSNPHLSMEIYEPSSITETYNHGKSLLCFNWNDNKWAFGQGATDNITGSTSTLGLGPAQSGTYGWGPNFFFTQSGYFGIGTQ